MFLAHVYILIQFDTSYLKYTSKYVPKYSLEPSTLFNMGSSSVHPPKWIFILKTELYYGLGTED